MAKSLSSQMQLAVKSACAFYGGIKPLSVSSGLNQGNLSSWVNGKPSLSDERTAIAWQALGLPDGKPDASLVHSWTIKRVFLRDYTPALKLFFPNGAKIARAPWVVPGPSLKDTFSIGDAHQTLYGITDGNVRAILRLPRSLLIQKENIHGFLKWTNGNQKNSVLDIPDDNNVWTSGTPTIREFDRAWFGGDSVLTEDDLLAVIREQGLTIEEAIGAIKRLK